MRKSSIPTAPIQAQHPRALTLFAPVLLISSRAETSDDKESSNVADAEDTSIPNDPSPNKDIATALLNCCNVNIEDKEQDHKRRHHRSVTLPYTTATT